MLTQWDKGELIDEYINISEGKSCKSPNFIDDYAKLEVNCKDERFFLAIAYLTRYLPKNINNEDFLQKSCGFINNLLMKGDDKLVICSCTQFYISYMLCYHHTVISTAGITMISSKLYLLPTIVLIRFLKSLNLFLKKFIFESFHQISVNLGNLYNDPNYQIAENSLSCSLSIIGPLLKLPSYSRCLEIHLERILNTRNPKLIIILMKWLINLILKIQPILLTWIENHSKVFNLFHSEIRTRDVFITSYCAICSCVSQTQIFPVFYNSCFKNIESFIINYPKSLDNNLLAQYFSMIPKTTETPLYELVSQSMIKSFLTNSDVFLKLPEIITVEIACFGDLFCSLYYNKYMRLFHESSLPKLNQYFNNWARFQIQDFDSITSIESLDRYINKSPKLLYVLYANKGIDFLDTIIRRSPNSDSFSDNLISILKKFCTDLLDSITLNEFQDPFGCRSLNELLRKNIAFRVKYNAKTYTHSCNPLSILLSLSSVFFNPNKDHVKELEMPPFLSVSFSEDFHPSPEELSIYYLLAREPGFLRLFFSCNSKNYIPTSSFLYLYISQIGNLDNPNTKMPIIELDLNKNNDYIIFDDLTFPSSVDKILMFVSNVFDLVPSLQIESVLFEESVKQLLLLPSYTFSGLGPAFSIVMKYFYLFSFNFRLAIIRIMYSPRSLSVSTFNSLFNLSQGTIIQPDISFDVRFHREEVFKAGLSVLNYLRAIPFVISPYMDNVHISTQEFFHLFENEMLSPNRSFIYVINDDDKHSLFPRPKPDPDQLYLFGVLMAKIISLQCKLNNKIKKEFFDLIKGIEVKLQNVNPKLHQDILDKKFIGQSFNYPGYPDVVFVANSSVNSENNDSFMYYVNSFTCGKEMMKYLQKFHEGFEKVFPISVLDRFTSEELIKILYE